MGFYPPKKVEQIVSSLPGKGQEKHWEKRRRSYVIRAGLAIK